MWLIHTKALKLEEFLGVDPPPYAILSHTWDVEEVTFREMVNGASRSAKAKKGYQKIKQTCRIAAENGLYYAWVDTCCIDKSSSAELSEAINSMFQWYERAEICYAYLSDFHPGVSEKTSFPKCRYFTRGWMLHELLAPVVLEFYDATWKLRESRLDATKIITKVTGIHSDYLTHRTPVRHASVAERMSWASRRTTTRVEDMAYCLLGMFDINMPMLYGEGKKAFLRLQEEIVRRTNDLSLLAWNAGGGTYLPLSDHKPHGCGVLAPSPVFFQTSGEFRYGSRDCEFSVTNKGIRVTAQLYTATAPETLPFYVLHLADQLNGYPVYLVLIKLDRDIYIRHTKVNGGLWDQSFKLQVSPLGLRTLYLPRDVRDHFDSDRILKERAGSVELHIPRENGRLKVFEVIPESLWDPALSLLLNPSSAVLLLLGDPKKPYGSVYFLALKRRKMGSLYLIPASSPAIPYVSSNLASLTQQDLRGFWNLEPAHLDRVPGAQPPNRIFAGRLEMESLKIDIRVRFEQVFDDSLLFGLPHLGLPYMRLSQLWFLQTEDPDCYSADSATSVGIRHEGSGTNG